jgi:hypothetical protein
LRWSILFICAGAQAIPNRRRCAGAKLGRIERACHPPTALVQNVRVDHRRLHAGVSEQLLHRTDIIPVFQQMDSSCGQAPWWRRSEWGEAERATTTSRRLGEGGAGMGAVAAGWRLLGPS